MTGHWNSRSAVIICPTHGEVSLSYKEFLSQVSPSNTQYSCLRRSTTCPICSAASAWADISKEFHNENNKFN